VDERYLSITRVRALSPRALARYLIPLIERENPATSDYLRVVLEMLRDDPSGPAELRRRAGTLRDVVTGAAGYVERDALSRARAALIEELRRGAGLDENAPAQEYVAAPRSLPGERPLPIVIWVPHIRSPFNGGNIVRSAAAFGIRGVVFGPDCPAFDHPRFLRAAMGGERLLEVVRGGQETARAVLQAATPGDASLVALETGGTPVERFPFPAAGVIALGHEELGLSERVLSAARATGGVVSIPLHGVKRSLNVGVALGAALSWWSAALRSADPRSPVG